MNKVQVWEEKVIIPTYEAGKPDKNPMFLEKRVYQGSSGRIYPHTVIEKISDEKVDKEYTALFLENDYLKVMMLPELGGRIQRAYDKTNGYDFIYYNHVIKPALVGLAGPWISGGIEFNWPQHHRPSTYTPIDWTIEELEDGGATVELDLTPELLNPLGMAHGGTIFTLCDIAAGSAAASQGTVAVTLDSTIHYYRPGRCGKKLTAVAYERKRGRKVSVYMVEVHDDEGKHIADATFTMFYTGATLDDMKY